MSSRRAWTSPRMQSFSVDCVRSACTVGILIVAPPVATPPGQVRDLLRAGTLVIDLAAATSWRTACTLGAGGTPETASDVDSTPITKERIATVATTVATPAATVVLDGSFQCRMGFSTRR